MPHKLVLLSCKTLEKDAVLTQLVRTCKGGDNLTSKNPAFPAKLRELQGMLQDAALVRGESRRKTVLGGGVVEMKKFSGPLEQISGQFAGLIVNPAGREVKRNSLA